jgi:ABC-2 type transport system permease protein
MADGGVIEAAPRAVVAAGRHPQAMVALQVGRKAVRSGALWGLIFGLYVIVQVLAYTSAYKTQAARDQLERAFGANVGINALIGPARAINTVPGYASWRALGILSLLGAIWGLLTATRLLRGEEDAGRLELLLAGQTTRRRAGGQAVAGLGAGLLVLFVLTALGTVLLGRAASVGFSVGQSLYFAVTLVAGATAFLAIGALSSQLANTRRRAASIAGVVFGISYAVRMVADSDPGLHWMVWLSPLGWIEESRPLIDPHPLALLPVLALVLVATAATLHLAGTRDLGAATLPARDTSAPHLALVGSQAGLAVRLGRPVALGWLFAVAAASVLIGTVAEAATKGSAGNISVTQALARLGGHGSLVAAYLGLTFLVLALMIAMIAAGQISAMRSEEAEGHLENLLVRPTSRTAWFATRLQVSAVLLVLAGLVAGIGAWAGAASQHTGVRFSSLLAAGLNVVPPALFFVGLGALVLGAWPRGTSAVVYGYLAWSFLIEFIGAVVRASHWLMDTSVFFHMVPAPAASPDWASAAAMTGIAAAAAVVGGILFGRRDVLGA